MAFGSAQKSRVYFGRYSLAAYARTASVTYAADMHDTTTLVDTAKQFIPGANTGTFSLSGPLDVAEDATPENLIAFHKDARGIAAITYMPHGDTAPAWLVNSYQTMFDTNASHSTTVDWSIATQFTSAVDMNGVILENNTTVTIDTDGTANNNGAGTTNGAVFHLHVTDFTGLTSDVITVEGSTTGAFAGEETTIATFTTVSAVFVALGGASRVEVTGTVPRYLRVVDDVTGTGSCTRLVAVSRR